MAASAQTLVNGEDKRPLVACYCATFLKPEMLHIYRQITALERVRPIVLTQKREQVERFPFAEVTVVPKSRIHFARRIWFRQLRGVPWTISRSETANLLRVLEQNRADLLHIFFGHIAVHLRPLIARWTKPSIVSFHGADVMVDLEKRAYRDATLRMLEAVRLVLVRSESLRAALVSLGCPSEKIRLQRTGIPLAETPLLEREFPADGSWRLLQAGRLIEKKGFRTSLRAFAKFARCYPLAEFMIAGEGPLLEALRQEASHLGIADHVKFAGFLSQEELRNEFHRAHIFLHPSESGSDGNQEGVPNSMLEAMASGLPVFATRHGGIPEAIENGVSGVLVSEGAADALAHALLSAAEQPERLVSIAQQGAAAVAAKFEQKAQIRTLEDYYFEAIRGC
ncbi:MAG: glycosyltransferase [Verrucomicrobiota bacterium]|nr:glycosyltransferase [Verrucomicrobiota bacterium]